MPAHSNLLYQTVVSSLSALCLLLLLSAIPVSAQQKEPGGQHFDSAFVIEEVIVTAQKRSENLQTVPIAVSVFSGDQLQQVGIVTAQTLQEVTPSLVFNNTSATAQPYLRGIGTRLSLMGLESSVATYSDDRYVSRPAAALLELLDVERVEVLKGPQGTLYGRNATGGAIRVITRDPADEAEAEINLGIGNFQYRRLSASGTWVISDQLKSRLTGLVIQRDGYVDNIVPAGEDEFDDKDFQSFRVKTHWQPNVDQQLRLNLEYWRRDDNDHNDVVNLSPPGFDVGSAMGGITTSDREKTATLFDDTIIFDQYAGTLRLDLAYEDFDFVSITTYSTLEGGVIVDADATSIRSLDAFSDDEAETWSQEFQWLGQVEEQWQWIAGLYYFTQEGRLVVFSDHTDLEPPLGPIGAQGRQSVETDSWAVFGQTTYSFDERWALTLGARWSVEEKDAETKTIPGVFSTTEQEEDFRDSDRWSEFTPRVSLEYQTDKGLLYLTYARGFKSGGFNYPAFGNEPLEPEILDMLEFGVKLDLWQQRLRLNSALFYYDYEDLQVSRAAGGDDFSVKLTTENAANAKVKGLEADLEILLSQYLSLSVGFSWLDSEYQDYDASARVFNMSLGIPKAGVTDISFDADGESLLRAPDFAGYLGINYRWQTDTAELPLVIMYSYKDEYDFDFVGHPDSRALTQDSYGLVNATLGYKPVNRNWQLLLWGNNLTDKLYYDDLVASSQGIRGSAGAPRTYGLNITLEF